MTQSIRDALAAPEPTADERVVEHMAHVAVVAFNVRHHCSDSITLKAIATELEAPAPDEVPVVAVAGYSPHQGYSTLLEPGYAPFTPENLVRQRDHLATVSALQARVAELEAKLNTPQLHDFASAVVLEAAHQRERWGADNDVGKKDSDWFWLLGHLAGKALNAAVTGNTDKALHHTISTAAACANWHAALSGSHTTMRPGIDLAEKGLV